MCACRRAIRASVRLNYLCSSAEPTATLFKCARPRYFCAPAPPPRGQIDINLRAAIAATRPTRPPRRNKMGRLTKDTRFGLGAGAGAESSLTRLRCERIPPSPSAQLGAQIGRDVSALVRIGLASARAPSLQRWKSVADRFEERLFQVLHAAAPRAPSKPSCYVRAFPRSFAGSRRPKRASARHPARRVLDEKFPIHSHR